MHTYLHTYGDYRSYVRARDGLQARSCSPVTITHIDIYRNYNPYIYIYIYIYIYRVNLNPFLGQQLCFLHGAQERIRSREIEGDDRAVTQTRPCLTHLRLSTPKMNKPEFSN